MKTQIPINTEDGLIGKLTRFKNTIAAGLVEIRDPIVGGQTKLENFQTGVHLYRYGVGQAKIAKSVKLDNDSWEYDGRTAQFRRDNDYHVALVTPGNYNPKYIHALSKSGREVVVALPEDLHVYVCGEYESMTGEKLHSISGGYIKKENSKFLLYGASGDYGRADHERVARLLTKLGFPAEAVK